MEQKATFDHEYSTTIQDKQIDMFGHVNNAAYLEVFEQARWDWITGNEYSRERVKETGIGPTLLEVTMRFKREITGRERVIVRSRRIEYRGKLMRLEQVMLRADGEIACAAEFVISLFDLKARKLIRPTPEWLRAVGLEGDHG